MLTIFIATRGIVYHKYATQNQNITRDTTCNTKVLFLCLVGTVQRKRPDLCATKLGSYSIYMSFM